MVKNASSLGKTGIQEWIIQRITAVILGIYIIFLGFYILSCDSLTYKIWVKFFSNYSIKFFTLLALLSMLYHAWIGMWTISTDYIKNAGVRLALQLSIKLVLFFCFFMGIKILLKATT